MSSYFLIFPPSPFAVVGMTALLEIRNLAVEFTTARGYSARSTGSTSRGRAAEIVGIVGESGSGKSVAMLAVMG